MVFEHMSLEETIKFYAVITSSDIEVQRVEVHSHLCDLLGVSYEDFKPFESKGITHIVIDEHEAERIIRKAIRELREKHAEQTKPSLEPTLPTPAIELLPPSSDSFAGTQEKYCVLCDRTLPDNFGNDPTNRRDGICGCGYALWDDNGELRWVGHRTPKPLPPPIKLRVRIVLASADEKKDGREKAEKRLKMLNELKTAHPASMPIEVQLLTPYVNAPILTMGVVWVPNGEENEWARKLAEFGVEVERIERMDYDEEV